MTGTRAEELITDDKGNVIGVKASKGNQKLEIRAKAVVLGTGGYARNQELLATIHTLLRSVYGRIQRDSRGNRRWHHYG